MSKFKVGDKVRVLAVEYLDGMGHLIGNEYEVTDTNGPYDRRIEIVESDSTYWSFYESELELVTGTFNYYYIINGQLSGPFNDTLEDAKKARDILRKANVDVKVLVEVEND